MLRSASLSAALGVASLLSAEIAIAQTNYPIVKARWNIPQTGSVPPKAVLINYALPPNCDQPTLDAIAAWNGAGSRFKMYFKDYTEQRAQAGYSTAIILSDEDFADSSVLMRMVSSKTYWYSIPEFTDAAVEVNTDKMAFATNGWGEGQFFCQYGDTYLKFDYQSIMGHELGHAFGLGHGEGTSPSRPCQLYFQFAREERRRVLCDGEKMQFRNLYDYTVNPRTPR